MHYSSQYKINPQKLTFLSKISKILYDDTTYVVLNYIISHDGQVIEEQDMVANLQINFGTMRSSLTTLKAHGILIETDHNVKPVEEEVRPDGGSSYNISTDTKINLHKRPLSYKKQKTSEWKINHTFYNTLKKRFETLKRQLKENLDNRATLRFECPDCHRIYSDSEGKFNNYFCRDCIKRPKLITKQKEDVTVLRKKVNEITGMIDELFNINDRSGPEFEHWHLSRGLNGPTRELGRGINKKFDITFERMEEEGIEKILEETKKKENKNRVFLDVMEYYVYSANEESIRKKRYRQKSGGK